MIQYIKDIIMDLLIQLCIRKIKVKVIQWDGCQAAYVTSELEGEVIRQYTKWLYGIDKKVSWWEIYFEKSKDIRRYPVCFFTRKEKGYWIRDC